MKGDCYDYGNPYQQGQMQDAFELPRVFKDMPSVCFPSLSNRNKEI
jgi:hypothetical protein